MAKMSKKVKSLILAAIILVVLGGILTLLLLLPNDSDSGVYLGQTQTVNKQLLHPNQSTY